jgi:ABC-type multidrug transport system ATPase subunit
VNGQPYTKATRKRIGFVLQDDVLYESLTVKVSLTGCTCQSSAQVDLPLLR